MRKSLFTILILVMIIQLQAQMDAGQLTFTAVFDDTYVMLDSIKIMNRTQGEDTMLVYPDTVLILDAGIGLPSHAAKAMELGFDAVLLNTAVARAGDPVKMAGAMSAAIQAGRAAFESDPIEPTNFAQPSTPVIGQAFLGA